MLRIFTSVHVPGHLNGVADMLSRGGPQVREWRLHPRIVAQIWDRFGRAEVDLFASAENSHCLLFFSITDKSAQLGVDALSHVWPRTLLYAFPPVDLIQPTLDRVRQEGLSLILVVHCWPAKMWCEGIRELLSGTPWCLPLRSDLLSQAGGRFCILSRGFGLCGLTR